MKSVYSVSQTQKDTKGLRLYNEQLLAVTIPIKIFFQMKKPLQNYGDNNKNYHFLVLTLKVQYIIRTKSKQDVFVKHNAPDNGQFQRRPRSQGQIF